MNLKNINELFSAKTLQRLVEGLNKGAKSAKKGALSAVRLINRHKVISCCVAAVLVLITAACVVLNYYLSLINYQSQNTPVTVTDISPTAVKLATGEEFDITKLKKDKDDLYTLPDGRRFDDDGTVWKTDGSIIFYDGSYLLADGTAVLSDGTTIYTDETVVFQNGKYIPQSGITVDSEGWASFPDGDKVHISAFTLAEDGTPERKPEDDVSPKYYTEPKQDEKTQSILSDSDDDIRANLNDSKIWYSDDVINILLMGIDYGSKTYPYGRSDAMIVVSVNKQTRKIKLVSFARSAYVSISGYENTRLSHAHGLGGAALTVDTIQRNYKIRIDNYISTGFDTFKQIIDCVGGVDITLTAKEAKALRSKLKKAGYSYAGASTYRLNGELALEYVRLRKIDTDRDRTGRQRKVLVAIANKVKGMNVFELNALLTKILPLITTDLSRSQIVSQLANVPTYLSSEIEQHLLPHKSSALTLRGGFEVVIIDWKDEVKYTHDLFYSGLTPKYYEQ